MNKIKKGQNTDKKHTKIHIYTQQPTQATSSLPAGRLSFVSLFISRSFACWNAVWLFWAVTSVAISRNLPSVLHEIGHTLVFTRNTNPYPPRHKQAHTKGTPSQIPLSLLFSELQWYIWTIGYPLCHNRQLPQDELSCWQLVHLKKERKSIKKMHDWFQQEVPSNFNLRATVFMLVLGSQCRKMVCSALLNRKYIVWTTM